METKTTIKHSETDIPASFATAAEAAFGGQVAVLPNISVMNECRRLSRRPGSVELSVALDDDGFTIYSVAGTLLLVDALDNCTTEIDVREDDDVDEIAEQYPAARQIAEAELAAYNASGDEGI